MILTGELIEFASREASRMNLPNTAASCCYVNTAGLLMMTLTAEISIL